MEDQVGAPKAILELRRASWRPNRLGQCSQCRQYRAKWRPGGQGGQHRRVYRAQLGGFKARHPAHLRSTLAQYMNRYITYIMYITCSRRYPSTRKFRIADVLLTSKVVLEVQMKLCSHWRLLCQFKWRVKGNFKAGSANAQSMFCFEL